MTGDGRYNRQQLIPGWKQDDLAVAKVLVVGAGTTGNEIIKNLALLGVGHLTIVDSDTIENVNLSRSVLFRTKDIGGSKAAIAAERAQEIQPGLDSVAVEADVIFGIGNLFYANFDCVLLALDNLEARAWVARYCWFNGTPYINTGIFGLSGNVSTHIPFQTACLECSWTQRHYDAIDVKYSCAKVGTSLEEPKIPMVINTAAMISGIATQEAVKILMGHRPNMASVVSYEGTHLAWNSAKVPLNRSCLAHNTLELTPKGVPIISVSVETKIDAVIKTVRGETGIEDVVIGVDKPLVFSVGCRTCGAIHDITPIWLGQFGVRGCLSCGGVMTPVDVRSGVTGDWTFAELGIPRNHILAISLVTETDEVRTEWVRIS